MKSPLSDCLLMMLLLSVVSGQCTRHQLRHQRWDEIPSFPPGDCVGTYPQRLGEPRLGPAQLLADCPQPSWTSLRNVSTSLVRHEELYTIRIYRAHQPNSGTRVSLPGCSICSSHFSTADQRNRTQGFFFPVTKSEMRNVVHPCPLIDGASPDVQVLGDVVGCEQPLIGNQSIVYWPSLARAQLARCPLDDASSDQGPHLPTGRQEHRRRRI